MYEDGSRSLLRAAAGRWNLSDDLEVERRQWLGKWTGMILGIRIVHTVIDSSSAETM